MQHLAIIMDGNRRWAHENALAIVSGHNKGAQALSEIGREVARLKIPFLTVFAFSAENWRRSKAEVNALFGLMRRYLKQEMTNLMSERNPFLVHFGNEFTPTAPGAATVSQQDGRESEVQLQHNSRADTHACKKNKK